MFIPKFQGIFHKIFTSFHYSSFLIIHFLSVFFSARIDQTSAALITVTFGFPVFSSCISFWFMTYYKTVISQQGGLWLLIISAWTYVVDEVDSDRKTRRVLSRYEVNRKSRWQKRKAPQNTARHPWYFHHDWSFTANRTFCSLGQNRDQRVCLFCHFSAAVAIFKTIIRIWS